MTVHSLVPHRRPRNLRLWLTAVSVILAGAAALGTVRAARDAGRSSWASGEPQGDGRVAGTAATAVSDEMALRVVLVNVANATTRRVILDRLRLNKVETEALLGEAERLDQFIKTQRTWMADAVAAERAAPPDERANLRKSNQDRFEKTRAEEVALVADAHKRLLGQFSKDAGRRFQSYLEETKKGVRTTSPPAR